MTERVSSLETAIANLASENKTLGTQLLTKETAIKDLTNKIQSYEAKIVELQNEVNTQVQLKAMQKEKESRSAAEDRIQEELLRKSRDKIIELESRLEALNGSCEQASKSLITKGNELEQVKQNEKIVRGELERVRREVFLYEEQIGDLITRNRQNEDETSALRKQIAVMASSMNEIEQDRDNWRTKYEKAMNGDLTNWKGLSMSSNDQQNRDDQAREIERLKETIRKVKQEYQRQLEEITFQFETLKKQTIVRHF